MVDWIPLVIIMMLTVDFQQKHASLHIKIMSGAEPERLKRDFNSVILRKCGDYFLHLEIFTSILKISME